ncbi:ABC transporter substrate-binding protein [Knoellia sp. DB2414S]|uniref:ABC transporter substrate-binding protein n=2 Tax=Knoellia koreensis TaxID=2730921 RepID=A0A849HJJ5_9MICO|nr:ABC transporter substrate-binding protein [Knoellia sp. DB2414S]
MASAAPAAAAKPAAMGQAKKVASSTVPVTGTLADGSAFSGALSGLKTSVVDGVLTMTGTVTGTGLPAGGTTFTAPVQSLAAPAGCNILNLDLGPLHLDLLGLVIDLAPVNLDITAVPGSGKLLGNLLCGIAKILDTGGPLSALLNKLNKLLSGLGLGL